MELNERIHELALTRSFFFPSNEIYGATSGFYDYGPVGTLIKKKIENLFRKLFLRQEGYHEMEAAIITPEIVLKASGHIDSFADPIAECKSCKTRVRADSFVEKEVEGYKWDGKTPSLDEQISSQGLRCPQCKAEFAPVKMFNLMFKTGIGAESTAAYSRPETAQGTYTAFLRIFRNHSAKLPLAVAQIGKSFRNEISPRKGIIRMREFTQMELQYFFSPSKGKMEKFSLVAGKKMRFLVEGKLVVKTTGEAVEEVIVVNEIMGYFLAKEWEYYKKCGIDESRMHFRVLGKGETPHYSKKNIDLEIETSYGAIEANGNAYRTDFDLGQHKKFSGKDMEVFIEDEKVKIIPHVFEAALGVDRLFYSVLEHCLREKDEKDGAGNWKLGTGKDWEWFDFPPAIAPYECAVFPLMKKDGMSEKAEEICNALRNEFSVFYQESASIGKRYARADEIGVPYAITVDYDTLKDGTVTLRYRNDGKQERVKISELAHKVRENVAKGKVSL